MLAAEMLFTQSLESSRKRPMRARAATPCVQRNAQRCRLAGPRSISTAQGQGCCV